LPDVKKQIIADQKAVLEPRRDAACAELKEKRAREYRGILDEQQEERTEFRGRMATMQDNSDFFRVLAERKDSRKEMKAAFRDVRQETTHDFRAVQARPSRYSEVEDHRENSIHSHKDMMRTVGLVPRKAVASVGSLLDALFFDVVNAGSAPKTNEPYAGERDEFAVAAEEATKQAQHQEREAVDDEWGQRQKAIRGE
jgi:hypothetical protein